MFTPHTAVRGYTPFPLKFRGDERGDYSESVALRAGGDRHHTDLPACLENVHTSGQVHGAKKSSVRSHKSSVWGQKVMRTGPQVKLMGPESQAYGADPLGYPG